MTTALRPWAILALLCTVAALFVLYVSAQSRERLATEVATLQLLRNTEVRLLQQLAAAQPAAAAILTQPPAEAVWPQDSLSAAERAIQDAVLQAAESARLTVISFGGQGGDARCIIPCSTYEAELNGGHVEVVAFLAAIEAVKPALSTRLVWMRQRPHDGVSASAPINLRAIFWALAPHIAKQQAE